MRFTEGSQPINVGEVEDSSKLHVSVAVNSIGHLLTVAKPEVCHVTRFIMERWKLTKTNPSGTKHVFCIYLV